MPMFGRARARARIEAKKRDEISKRTQKLKREDKAIEIDEGMKNRKVFGNIRSDGRVVTKSKEEKQKELSNERRREEMNWGPQVQGACDRVLTGFEREFKEDMKFTCIMLLKYLEIQKAKKGYGRENPIGNKDETSSSVKKDQNCDTENESGENIECR